MFMTRCSAFLRGLIPSWHQKDWPGSLLHFYRQGKYQARFFRAIFSQVTEEREHFSAVAVMLGLWSRGESNYLAPLWGKLSEEAASGKGKARAPGSSHVRDEITMRALQVFKSVHPLPEFLPLAFLLKRESPVLKWSRNLQQFFSNICIGIKFGFIWFFRLEFFPILHVSLIQQIKLCPIC